MLLDPLQNYAWSGGYMPFGFQFILPAFASSIVLVFHYHVKSAIVLVVIFFMTMLIFANKGSILAALILLFVGVTYIKNGYHISRKVIISSLLFLIFLLLAYREILNFALSIMDKLGVDSYALATIQIMLEDTSNNSVYDTRLNIWQDSLTFFSKSPIIGCGIGYYSSQRDVYEHNLFLEVMNAWGIVGLFLLTIIFYKCYKSFVTAHTPALKLIMILFIILGFVPLMSSLTLWRHTPFWIILALSFRKKQKSRS